MPSLRLVPVLALLTFTGLAATAHASAPAGVWGLVDEVTLEPDDQNPTMVRIDGVLMIANVLPDFPDYPGYSEPQLGYMYYSCEGKQLVTCVMEWKELMALAGTPDNCRGWGSNNLPSNGVLRHPQLPMKDPDPYPIAMGVVPGFSPCEALRKWQMENVGESTTGEPGTGSSTSDGDTEQVSTSVTGSSTDPLPGTTGEPATSTEAATSTDPGTTGPETSSDGATSDTPTSETGAVTGGPGGSTGGASGGSTGAPAEPGTGDDKGCACDSRGAPGLTGLLGLGLLGLLRRRRGR